MSMTLKQAREVLLSMVGVSEKIDNAYIGEGDKIKLILASRSEIDSPYMERLQAEAQKTLGRKLNEDDLDIRISRPRPPAVSPRF